ncbi:uncharacterized protein K460DRAFT_275068, partial [Cucurbitaria berberidis CBS 394.84]
CTLPQGATNLVAIFICTIIKIFKNYFLNAALFINNIGVAGLKSKYNNKKVLDRIY